jgi:hypothetical protein
VRARSSSFAAGGGGRMSVAPCSVARSITPRSVDHRRSCAYPADIPLVAMARMQDANMAAISPGQGNPEIALANIEPSTGASPNRENATSRG